MKRRDLPFGDLASASDPLTAVEFSQLMDDSHLPTECIDSQTVKAMLDSMGEQFSHYAMKRSTQIMLLKQLRVYNGHEVVKLIVHIAL